MGSKSTRYVRGENRFRKRHRRTVTPINNPSALGIRRISDIELHQVMHANQSDINRMRKYLNTCDVSNFSSWPVLLRALTHPSISNWAERVQALPARSLGPNTLELLGDRVVGVCVAHAIHSRLSSRNLDDNKKWKSLEWIHSPRMLLRSLVGNRGMAHIAEATGIGEMLRWERPSPPQAHRKRTDIRGRDAVTGIMSNVEINALSSAYEAVTAAVYLDGGLSSAQQFVETSMLTEPRKTQCNNYSARDYEDELISTVTRLLGGSLSFVPERRVIGSNGSLARKSFERWQLEILNLQEIHMHDQVNPAHEIFYAGVMLRKMSNVEDDLNEVELISLASHFSKENARIAALTQARDILTGRAEIQRNNHLQRGIWKKLGLREMDNKVNLPELTVQFEESKGCWIHQTDYKHLGNVLMRVESPGWSDCITQDDEAIRTRLQIISQEGKEDEDDDHDDGYDNILERNQPISTFSQERFRHGQREEILEPVTNICPDIITDCLMRGWKMDVDDELVNTHAGLRCDDLVEISGTDVVETIKNEANRVNEKNISERNWEVRAYYNIGHNISKLWAVQRSIKGCDQDRSEVMQSSLKRLSHGYITDRQVLGYEGKIGIRDLRNHQRYVGLGICSKELGLKVVLQWLSGAEQRLVEEQSLFDPKTK